MAQAERREKALKMYNELKVKNPNLSPISVEGSVIAKTWWGKAWCINFEKYKAYQHLLVNARKYLRDGWVLDLQIEEGCIKSLTVGNWWKPYEITIKINLLSDAVEKKIMQLAGDNIEFMDQLLLGKFPEELGNLFLQQGGIFPTFKDISLTCICPNTHMCKHCIAALYGFAVHLDKNPLLLFKLRGINFNAFLKKTLERKLSLLMPSSKADPERAIEDCDVERIFGA